MTTDDPIRAAVLAERARCQAIVTAKEAIFREDVAHHLAFSTDLEPQVAIGIMTAAAESRPMASDFARYMRTINNPAVRPDPDQHPPKAVPPAAEEPARKEPA